MHRTRTKYTQRAERWRDYFRSFKKPTAARALNVLRRRASDAGVYLRWQRDGKPVYVVNGRRRPGVSVMHVEHDSTHGNAAWPCRLRGRVHGAYVQRQVQRWLAGVALSDRKEDLRSKQPCRCLVDRVLPTLRAHKLRPLASEVPVWDATHCTAIDLLATDDDGTLVLIEVKTSRRVLGKRTRAAYFKQLRRTFSLFLHTYARALPVKCLLLEINAQTKLGRLHRLPTTPNSC